MAIGHLNCGVPWVYQIRVTEDAHPGRESMGATFFGRAEVCTVPLYKLNVWRFAAAGLRISAARSLLERQYGQYSNLNTLNSVSRQFPLARIRLF